MNFTECTLSLDLCDKWHVWQSECMHNQVTGAHSYNHNRLRKGSSAELALMQATSLGCTRVRLKYCLTYVHSTCADALNLSTVLMLAERRTKEKWCVDPRNTHWSNGERSNYLSPDFSFDKLVWWSRINRFD